MHSFKIAALLMAVLLSSGPISADMAVNFSPRLGELKYTIDAGVVSHWRESTDQPDREMGFTRYDAKAFIPITQDDSFEWAAYMKYGAVDVEGTPPMLPTARDRFPDALYDITLGTALRKKLANNWILGGNLAVGSPSDRPFGQIEDVAVSGNAFLQMDWKHDISFVFMLNYASNRSYLPHAPLPGFAMIYSPSRNLRAIAGVPYSSIYWRPEGLEKLEVEASYLMMRQVHGRIGYDILKGLQVYAAYDFQNDRWYRHDRKNDDHRLWFYEQQVRMGVRWDIIEGMMLDVYGGYAFDRYWFEASSYDHRDYNRIDIDDGPILGLQFRYRF
jgi:hypothetical protein